MELILTFEEHMESLELSPQETEYFASLSATMGGLIVGDPASDAKSFSYAAEIVPLLRAKRWLS